MEKLESQLRHDFINNSLRIEVLSKLICQSLESDSTPDKKYLEDFDKFLKEEITLLGKVKKHFANQ
jgi:hypothetical protein